MKIRKDELVTIINEEINNVVKENLFSKTLSSVLDTYTRLNVGDDKGEESRKIKISDKTFEEILIDFLETFQKSDSPMAKDKNVLSVLQNTLIGAFSSVVDASAPKAEVQSPSEIIEEVSTEPKGYQGDYYIAYNVIGNLFLKAFAEIYKKVEFELNRQLGYLIKNTFKGNLEAFKTNLTKAFAYLKTSVEAKIKSDEFKEGLLNQQTHRKLVVLEENIDNIKDQNTLLKLEKEMQTLWLEAKIEPDLKERAKKILAKSVRFRFRKVKKVLLGTQAVEEYGELIKYFINSSPESAKQALMQIITKDKELKAHREKIESSETEVPEIT